MIHIEVMVESHPTLICCLHRLPDGDLFKRKYIGYGRRAAVAQFRREVREELRKLKA